LIAGSSQLRLACFEHHAGSTRPAEGSYVGHRLTKNGIVIAGDRPLIGAQNILDVVLVEDDDTVADVIEHALGHRDYTFVRFADGAELVGTEGSQESQRATTSRRSRKLFEGISPYCATVPVLKGPGPCLFCT
jgi:hypothetical protein